MHTELQLTLKVPVLRLQCHSHNRILKPSESGSYISANTFKCMNKLFWKRSPVHNHFMLLYRNIRDKLQLMLNGMTTSHMHYFFCACVH